MNTKTPVLVTVLGLALLTGFSIAATTTAVPPPAPIAAPAPAGPPDEFRARIAEKLGLSADQQKAIDDLRVKERAELQALDDSKNLTPDVRREKARAIFENFHAQMRAVLTPEQQQKMGEWRGHMMERGRMAGRPHQGFAPGPGGQGDRRGPAMQPTPPANPLAIVAMGERIKDRIAEKLQLTDEQRDKLDHLGRAYRAQQRDAAKKHLEEMRAVLTPEQQQKVEQWKQHFHRGPDGEHPPFLSMNEGPGDMAEDMAGDLPMPPEEN